MVCQSEFHGFFIFEFLTKDKSLKFNGFVCSYWDLGFYELVEFEIEFFSLHVVITCSAFYPITNSIYSVLSQHMKLDVL